MNKSLRKFDIVTAFGSAGIKCGHPGTQKLAWHTRHSGPR